MVQMVSDDLFESNAHCLINAVNCVGVMGRGLALEFKRRYPNMFSDYVSKCRGGMVRLGVPYLFNEDSPWIINFPTKRHWRDSSRLVDIESGLKYLKANYLSWGLKSIAVPALGCGLGGLRWSIVEPILIKCFNDFDIDVVIYRPV